MITHPPRALALAVLALFSCRSASLGADRDGEGFGERIRPILAEFCLDCHSTEKQKGDLDLERFESLADVKSDARVWQQVEEQLEFGEMPPEKKPQPSAAQKAELTAWVHATLGEIGREHAGDPGPVVVRRLSNAEFGYTLRDLTGIASLDPAREFPVDGAAGEGFTNTGAALVMSPALFTKYLDAAKEVAAHAVLLPDGIEFSEKTTPRDWTEEKLAAIRAFYAKFTETGGGSSVNLQGIKFDTRDGGVLDLESYLAATVAERDTLAASRDAIADVARDRGLNAKYLGTLWDALDGGEPSLLLDRIRGQWRQAKPADVPALVGSIEQWQKALWRFTSVGHIGKRDGPEAWQEPLLPLASEQEIRLKLPEPAGGEDITIYLVASDAGDGDAGDAVVWKSPRIVSGNLPPIRLRDAESLVERLDTLMALELGRSTEYLQCLAEAHANGQPVDALVEGRKLDPVLAASWASIVDLGHSSAPQATGHFTERLTNDGVAAIRGWGSNQTPSLIVNSSGETVRISTVTLPARGVTIHPSPTQEAVVYWRSPFDGRVRLGGQLTDTDANCGNGIEWRVEIVTHGGTAKLAAGAIDNGGSAAFAPGGELEVKIGDLVRLAVNPRGGDHSCDTTQITLTISEVAGQTRVWDLAQDVVGRIHESNPLADSYGNASTWHFCSSGGGPATGSIIPPGSVLARWREAVVSGGPAAEAALALQQLLTSPDKPEAPSDADKTLRDALLDWNGRLGWMALATASTGGGTTTDPGDIEATAPSVLSFRLPARLAAGAEFVSTGTLHPVKGSGGSVQMQALLTRPPDSPGLTAGTVRELGGKSTWSDGVSPVGSENPILVAPDSGARRRISADLEEFRQLFPAALCYTKIVPVDEVVTLTLFYREDEHLRRLMLDDDQAAELDRLWDQLHFVSEDALKLVDGFEQLWQFATQDADPSAFEPMREPIRKAAAEFREKRSAAEPYQLEAAVKFAERAWRHPLASEERDAVRAFYRKLRGEELPHPDATRLTLARILVAPAFLYKLEQPGAGTAPSPVSDAELATRLSYFLWSSAPDAELSALAAAGKLRDPDVLAAQAHRMLADARVRRLAIEFGSQWLHVRDFDQLDEKSERHFPEFTTIRGALNEEPIRFFTDLFQRDGSVIDLLDADHTFVDASLANFYGMAAVQGGGWQRVDGVRAHGRGGVLGFGATLAKQSGASRTSAILRGTWVSETLLGEHLPRPPKGVPILPEEPPAGLTERAFTERHSSDPSCARCHERFDPYGFSLENFDAIGHLRQTDSTGLPIDAHARTADGVELEGIGGLRHYLLTERRDDFVRQFCRKLVGYALGRAVQLSDAPLLDAMQAQLAASGSRVGVAIEMIVRSQQFREIRGREHPTTE